MKKIAFILVFLCLISGMAFAQSPTFTTQVRNKTAYVGEPFRIIFTIKNGNKISGFQPPKFNNFTVLGNSSSRSISIINGKTSRKLSYIFILRPQTAGRFTIAGAQARINGNAMKSNPVTITVEKASANNQTTPSNTTPRTPSQANRPSSPYQQQLQSNPAILKKGEDAMKKIKKNLFVRVSVNKKEAYVGEQILAEYKLYTRIPASSKVTKVPSFSGFSTHDISLGNVNRPTTKTIDGKKYRVYTFRKSVIIPLQAGKQSLEPVQIENNVKLYSLEKSAKQRDPFSGMFNDPFFKKMFNDPFFRRAFGSGFELKTHEYDYKMSSPTVNIKVDSLPEKGKPKSFNGAVGQFSISSKINKSKLTTDDAVTFTVTINGTGNIDLIGVPTIDFPGSLESYAPKTEDNFNKQFPFGGTRSFTFILMPNSTGKITIPSVDFSYFNPKTKSYKTLHTQSYTLSVSQGENAQNKRLDSNNVNYSNSLYPIIKKKTNWEKMGPIWFGSWWHWTLMLLPILLLLILFFWKRRNDELLANQVLLKNKKANKVALKRLSLARKFLKKNKNKAFYEEVSHAIWGYLCDKLNIPLSELTKQKAAVELKKKHISEDALKKLFTLLDRCEMALYAGESGHEHMADTYKEAAQVISKLESKLKKVK